jgi:hypothetical protein
MGSKSRDRIKTMLSGNGGVGWTHFSLSGNRRTARFSCNVEVASLSNRSPISIRISVGSRLSIVGNEEFVRVD